MPTYEYRCPDGHDFEHFFPRISEAKSSLACPVCGKTAERRISAGGGLLFKGSGFYITDYGKDGKKADREKSAASSSKPSEGAKKDATSASTASPKTESKSADASKSAPSGGDKK